MNYYEPHRIYLTTEEKLHLNGQKTIISYAKL